MMLEAGQWPPLPTSLNVEVVVDVEDFRFETPLLVFYNTSQDSHISFESQHKYKDANGKFNGSSSPESSRGATRRASTNFGPTGTGR